MLGFVTLQLIRNKYLICERFDCLVPLNMTRSGIIQERSPPDWSGRQAFSAQQIAASSLGHARTIVYVCLRKPLVTRDARVSDYGLGTSRKNSGGISQGSREFSASGVGTRVASLFPKRSERGTFTAVAVCACARACGVCVCDGATRTF